MKTRPILALLAATALSSCATVFTPERCLTILTTARSAQEIIRSLVDIWHFDAVKAAALANLLLSGQETAAVICAASNPTP